MAWWDIGGDLTNLAQRAFGSTPEAGYYIAAPAAAAAAPASSGGWWDSLKSFLTPVVGYGKEQLALVEAGKLPESIESEIALWIQGAKQRARDFYARIGQGDSGTLRPMEDLIDQRAISMRAAALQDQARLGIGSLSSGAGAYGTGGGIAGQAGATATAQGQSIEELIRQANEAMAALSGGAA